ncbi:hypothetical protein BaRGS_00034109 [Batillaria attramentaria]|uniref:Uncharacterized protein n=1 Tax=Batillaria attramentaria TaxID=370345 RepID=A0ABD0JIS1_9CAEN
MIQHSNRFVPREVRDPHSNVTYMIFTTRLSHKHITHGLGRVDLNLGCASAAQSVAVFRLIPSEMCRRPSNSSSAKHRQISLVAVAPQDTFPLLTSSTHQ